MEAVRIVVHQNSANYRREESLDNKMTYPLPPLSTIIGALHKACGYTEYHPMDISIQGKYGSIHKEPYTDYCFLNSTMDDRGILVKLRNAHMLSGAFDRVASAQKSQGNSFRKQITVQVHNQPFMQEYLELKDLGDQIKEFKDKRLKKVFEIIKQRKKSLAEKKKLYGKGSKELVSATARENEIKNLEKEIKDRLKMYEMTYFTLPLSKYRSLVTSLKYYEILNDIDLVIHIKAEKETLEDILENVYNLKAIGRSEDFIEVQDAQRITLKQGETYVENEYSAYLRYEDIIENRIFPIKASTIKAVNGTKYYLNKNYILEDNKRVFSKQKAVYLSHYCIETTSDDVWIDDTSNKAYIVNFL